MGNQVTFRTSLDIGLTTLLNSSDKTTTLEIEGLNLLPIDEVLPLYRRNYQICNIKIKKLSLFDTNKTIIEYMTANEKTLVRECHFEFNWILKLRSSEIEEALDSEGEIEFKKSKEPNYRYFPIGIPIELWRYPIEGEKYKAIAIAKIKIKEINMGNNETSGRYEVLKVFDETTRNSLSSTFI